MNWNDLLWSKSVHQNWSTFKKGVNNLLDEFVPFKMLESASVNKAPWLRERDLKKAHKLHQGHVEVLKSGLYVDKLEMEHSTRTYHTALIEAKGRYENTFLQKHYVKNYINPSPNIQCLMIDDKKVTNQPRRYCRNLEQLLHLCDDSRNYPFTHTVILSHRRFRKVSQALESRTLRT